MSTAPRRVAVGVSRRRLLVGLAWLVLLGGALILLYPVLASPVSADDRYWYLEVPGRTGGSFAEAAAWTFGDMEELARNHGRITTLAFLARRFSSIIVMDLAVATSTPVVGVQAGMKLVLLTAVVLSCLAYVRVLRYRDSDGDLRRLSGRVVTVVTATTIALLSVGAQAHSQFRNGWTSYALLTYGAAIIMVGTVALMVWLTRLAARHGRAALVVAVLVAVVLAVVLNTSYELYYVAVPLILLAVLQQPMLHGRRQAGERRAKIWVGGAFAGTFLTCFVAIRAWVARLCAQRTCYEGAQPDLGTQTIITAVRNLLTAVPGGARSELAVDLRSVSMENQFPGFATPLSVLISMLVALSLFTILWIAGIDQGGAKTSIPRRAEARLLLLAATVPLAAALGTALVMALSVQAQDIVLAVGHPYRNTMVTWTMLALAAAFLTAAGSLLRRRACVVLCSISLVVLVLGSHTMAGNYPALRAYRAQPQMQATDAVQWQVVLGDRSEHGDERRCATVDQVNGNLGAVRSRERVLEGADDSFRLYHGLPYCSAGVDGD